MMTSSMDEIESCPITVCGSRVVASKMCNSPHPLRPATRYGLSSWPTKLFKWVISDFKVISASEDPLYMVAPLAAQ